MSNEYSKEALEQIIENEFFNDNNPLDCDLVDTAIVRLMKLDGQTIDNEALQQEREHMIYGVLKRILKPRG